MKLNKNTQKLLQDNAQNHALALSSLQRKKHH